MASSRCHLGQEDGEVLEVARLVQDDALGVLHLAEDDRREEEAVRR